MKHASAPVKSSHSLSSTRTERVTSRRRDVLYFKRRLKRHLPELQTRFDVKTLGVFGSYVRGQAKAQSDLDILVEYKVAPSFFTFIELEEYLTQLLGVKVDLVLKSALKPAIGRRILSEVEMI